MTTKELHEKIQASNSPEWFDEISLSINFYHEESVTKNGFISIYHFIERELKNWKSYENLPQNLREIATSYTNAVNGLNQIINNIESWRQSDFINFWNRSVINNFPANRKFHKSDSPSTHFLLDIYIEHPSYYQGANDYISNQITSNNINTDYISGINLAFEFKNEPISNKKKRKEAAKRSLNQIRAQFEHTFNEINDSFKKIDEDWTEHTKIRLDDLNDSLTERENSFDEWYKESQDSNADFNLKAQERLEQLEKTYDEKLKLEKPADYWDQRAKALRKDGWKWLNWLIGFTVGGAILFFLLLILITTGDIENIFSKVGTAIKWSIVLITFVSFIAFGIRTFAKLAYSSFHLVRDAEERKHLVYVFLALSNEKDLDKDERNLIIQSIFSRSDSGLLREESSPTMPGSTMFFEKLFK